MAPQAMRAGRCRRAQRGALSSATGMVSTRRSQGSGAAVAAAAGAADATSAEPQQPPLQQGDAQRPKAAPRSTRRSGGRAAEEPPQPEQQQQQGQQQDQQQQQQHDDPWAACLSDSDDDEQDAAGPSVVLDHLAQSIRAAFQSKAAAAGTSKGQAGERRPPQQPQQQPAQDAPGDALHWKPEILPPAAKPSKREVLQVQVPADKPAGLAKQVVLGPRDPKEAARAQQPGGGRKKQEADTAGKGWFDLPAQRIDDNTKRELRLLRLRGAFDPKRFYKSFDNTKFPKHFAFGTVVEAPHEYYSGRLEATQRRKATLTEQLLVDSDITQSRKKRYAKLQEEATRHQKVKKRKTELPRLDKPKHRPKH